MSTTIPTEQLFAVAVTENEHVLDAKSGLVLRSRKRVIYTNSALPAYNVSNAKIQAVLEAGKVEGDDAISDVHELEVDATQPFRE